jgi:hypothetical protein
LKLSVVAIYAVGLLQAMGVWIHPPTLCSYAVASAGAQVGNAWGAGVKVSVVSPGKYFHAAGDGSGVVLQLPPGQRTLSSVALLVAVDDHPMSVVSAMAPVTAVKIGPPTVVGLIFGSNHGFTHIGATGTPGPPPVPWRLEGL